VTFLRKRKGVSGVISGVFLVAIAVMIFNVLAWQFFQYDAYHRTALERDQREWERFNERIEITDVGYGSYLRFKVRNMGGVTARIVTVYLNDISSNIPRTLVLANYITSNCSAWISPGTEKWIYTTIPVAAYDSYDLCVATERGNLGRVPRFLYSREPGAGQELPFTFGFRYNDFQYMNNLGVWTPAWTHPSDYKPSSYRVYLTNTYDVDATIVGPDSRISFITDDFQAGNLQVATASGDQTLLAGKGDFIYFGALANKLNAHKHYFVFIELYYKLQGSSNIMGTMVGLLAILT